jgi:hypothetical protein
MISRFSKQFIRAALLLFWSFFVPSSLLFFFNNFHTIVHHPHQNLAVRMAAVSNICANFEEVGQVRAFNAPFFSPLSLFLFHYARFYFQNVILTHTRFCNAHSFLSRFLRRA